MKRPVVKIAEIADSPRIIENGVRLFFDTYKDTIYDGGLVAKLGIYCGTIEKLEEVVYPIVSSIAAEYGISSDAILKFHKGNKQYPQPTDKYKANKQRKSDVHAPARKANGDIPRCHGHKQSCKDNLLFENHHTKKSAKW